MSDDLMRRLEALERKLNNADRPGELPPGAGLVAVVIHGALPPGIPLWAVFGEHELIREPDEELEAFAERAMAAARELGEKLCVIGGLPTSAAQFAVAEAAYDLWAASDDGIPPVETRR